MGQPGRDVDGRMVVARRIAVDWESNIGRVAVVTTALRMPIRYRRAATLLAWHKTVVSSYLNYSLEIYKLKNWLV